MQEEKAYWSGSDEDRLKTRQKVIEKEMSWGWEHSKDLPLTLALKALKRYIKARKIKEILSHLYL